MANEKAVLEVGKTPRFEILLLLLRRGMMSAREIAPEVGLSYMGVRDQCALLIRDGYVRRKLRRAGRGRPEVLFGATGKAQGIFAPEEGDLPNQILESVAEVYDERAPEKVLFVLFRRYTETFTPKGAHTLQERVEGFVNLRNQHGWNAQILEEAPTGIVERADPLKKLRERWPMVDRLEEQMVGKILGVSVRAEQSGAERKFLIYDS